MAVTSWAGANGFSRRMLLGTPCDAPLIRRSPETPVQSKPSQLHQFPAGVAGRRGLA